MAIFFKKVLPGNAPVKSKIIKPDFTEHPYSPTHIDTTCLATHASLPSKSHKIIYETPKRSEEEEDERASYVSEPEVAEFSTKQFGSTTMSRPMRSALGMWIKFSGFEGRPTELLNRYFDC